MPELWDKKGKRKYYSSLAELADKISKEVFGQTKNGKGGVDINANNEYPFTDVQISK